MLALICNMHTIVRATIRLPVGSQAKSEYWLTNLKQVISGHSRLSGNASRNDDEICTR